MSTISGEALTQCGLSLATPEAFLRSYRLQRIAIDQVPTRTSQCGLLAAQLRLAPLRGRCPLRVIGRHSVMSDACPLYPRKRTFRVARAMSAKCQ